MWPMPVASPDEHRAQDIENNIKEIETMVISVAAYASDEVRKVVLKSDNIRHRTLEKCYSIPGYTELPRKVKNAVYDDVRLRIEKEITL